jgi:hypothetical protein
MSQEYSNRRQRRNNRARASRPVLVTSSDATNTPVSEEQLLASEATETATDVAEPEPLPVPTPASTGQRRLPRFFSTVSKSEQETQAAPPSEQTVAQARIARATRGKAASVPAAKATSETNEKAVVKPTASSTTRPATARPAQTGFFKTRYIIGLGIYLLVADFVGVYEAQLLTKFGMERILTQLNLFGLPIQVRTSTLFFLATLVIVLVVLAYFDLLPRSLGAARTTGGTNRSGRTTTSDTLVDRTPQQTMRQGVKGSNDELYQAYRSKQRRDRKR